MRKITKKIFVHISQTDNIIIIIMSLLKHMLKILPVINMRLSLSIEGFETPSRKNRDSRGGGIITYDKYHNQ
jgi:hypothetical protein